MHATFYILWSIEANKFYVGHTTDAIEERIRRHNSNHKGFTGQFQDWKLIYFESYPTKELVYKSEREVKAWKSKKRIQRLIAGSGRPAQTQIASEVFISIQSYLANGNSGFIFM